MMNATARLLEQRSVGHVKLHVGPDGVVHLRESGSAKVRMPRGSNQAILINTGGGLAGGDEFHFNICSRKNTSLTVTSQAAERVYRTLGPPASITTALTVEAEASLLWLPQETILFDGAALERTYSVTLDKGSRFLAVEPVVFGRTEMGETVKTVYLHDRWRINRNGALLHADDLRIGPDVPQSRATFDGALAMATLIYVADDAEQYLDAVRAALGDQGGASAWNGKLIARVVAKDGFHLRKALIPALYALIGRELLPKIWTF